MKSLLRLLPVVLLTVTAVSHAGEFESPDSWQMSRLFQPSAADLASEKRGRVMIYDGMTDKTVDRALDEQFDRIGALMFTRTVVTDAAGEPLRDPETGEIEIEDDGCD